MKKGIVGNGGFGREVYHSLESDEKFDCKFFVDDEYYDEKDKNTLPLSKFDPLEFELVIAIADPQVREKIVNKLPKETKYFTHINKNVIILGNDVNIGEGSILCSGTIITTNISIGRHSHLNLQTTIGHDTKIGDYFTTAPGSKISGSCIIGDRVYLGTNSSIREKIKICNDVTVGLNCGVVKNIETSGVYGGTPAKLIK